MVTHPICLRGIREINPDGKPNPTILQRTDQVFIDAILEQLTQEQRWTEIAKTLATEKDEENVLTLFQPVHQAFHVVLLEATCDLYEQPDLQPRLDPQKIESAGLVLRRLRANGQTLEGWRQAGTKLKGWVRFSQTSHTNRLATLSNNQQGLSDQDLDPDPQLRQPELSAGNREINRRLAGLSSVQAPLSESFSLLFVTPPEVCQAAKKTILYGLIPVTSAEVSEVESDFNYTLDEILQQLPSFLKQGSSNLPKGGMLLERSVLEELSNEDTDENRQLKEFLAMLRLLLVELDAFGEGEASQALLTTLNQIELTYTLDNIPSGIEVPSNQPFTTTSEFLEQAAIVLVNRVEGETILMPDNWPTIAEELANQILRTTKRKLDTRMAELLPRRGRYDDPNAQYQVRAFIRVQQEEDCPTQLVWSDYSVPFTISPWYENGPLPPIQVVLPEVTRDSVQKLKPNVSFIVPKTLFNVLDINNPSDFIDGQGSFEEAADNAFDWICSFNIPIITICAFIVLSIFLQLFHIIFWWLPFVRICIPFPRRS